MGGGASLEKDLRNFNKELNAAAKLKKKGVIGDDKHRRLRNSAMEHFEASVSSRKFQVQKERLKKTELEKIAKLKKFKLMSKEEAEKAEAECIKKWAEMDDAANDDNSLQLQAYEAELASAKAKLVESKRMFESGMMSESDFNKFRQDFVDLFARGPPKPFLGPTTRTDLGTDDTDAANPAATDNGNPTTPTPTPATDSGKANPLAEAKVETTAEKTSEKTSKETAKKREGSIKVKALLASQTSLSFDEAASAESSNTSLSRPGVDMQATFAQYNTKGP